MNCVVSWFQDLYSLACNRRVWSMSIMIEPDVFLLKCVLLSHFKSYRSCMASMLHCVRTRLSSSFMIKLDLTFLHIWICISVLEPQMSLSCISDPAED